MTIIIFKNYLQNASIEIGTHTEIVKGIKKRHKEVELKVR